MCVRESGIEKRMRTMQIERERNYRNNDMGYASMHIDVQLYTMYEYMCRTHTISI